MAREYVLALDAGTTSSRAILFDSAGQVVSLAQQEFPQHFPRPGWVEHDPMDIWNTQITVAHEALARANAGPEALSAIGITNQRETTVVWERATGKPIHNAIVWQDHRTASFCDELKARGLSDHVRQNTGLVIDSYFSGTKIRWMLDNVPGARARAERGDLAFGTVDSWLIWNLTGGRVHVTDYSNASRTMLFNIKRGDWDDCMLQEIGVPRSILPRVLPSSQVYGMTGDAIFPGGEVPVAASAGDQQAALFGQACFKPGMVKATYGTGGSLLMNTGDVPVHSTSGLLTTMACCLNGRIEYALEGLLFIVGAAVQWLRDGIKIIHDSEDTEYFASKVKDTNGVYVVPAFVGLSAPYWDPWARGAILGLTRGVNRNHIIRATLESIAYQIRDVIDCMQADSGIPSRELKVDGGAAKNNFLMQFQADLLGMPVLRPKIVEATARGAAFLAGLATGFWRDQEELANTFELDRRFEPAIDRTCGDRLYAGWKKAVGRVGDWEEH